MKLGVLFSGGKDSAYALCKARQSHEIMCLITIRSRNEESYMFHTPNIDIVELQAEAIGLPLISFDTDGEKESELQELRQAMKHAVELFGIEGIVTGAIESVYQATRIQRICDELGLWCFNPLWKTDQLQLLHELLDAGFEVIVSGVFAYPFDEKWLGRRLDAAMVSSLKGLQEKFKINPAGEGGEIETTVLNAPFFHKRIAVKESSVRYKDHNGVFIIEEGVLI
jgi:diphthine-ammonia ligase